jgi:hypothetical protein
MNYRRTKTSRFKRYFLSYSVFFLETEESLWYNMLTGIWEELGTDKRYEYCSVCECSNIRKFRRHLKKLSKYLPKGTEVVLTHSYVGVSNVTAYLTKKRKKNIVR